jgi:hypothetical protein
MDSVPSRVIRPKRPDSSGNQVAEQIDALAAFSGECLPRT